MQRTDATTAPQAIGLLKQQKHDSPCPPTDARRQVRARIFLHQSTQDMLWMRKPVLVAVLCVWALEALYAQVTQVTIGAPLEQRPWHEASEGQVTVCGGSRFEIGGLVQTWSFVSTGISNRAVTPLLFEQVSDTDWVLRATGASRTIFDDGIHTFAFDPEAGEPNIEPTFTFGFTDRVAYVPDIPSTNPVVTAQRNAGVVDFGYAAGEKWYFSSNETFEIRLGQVYRLNGVTEGNVVRLQEDPQGARSYSAQMSAVGLRPAVSVSIHRAIEICWPSATNQQYQVQWTPTLFTNWQDLGQRILGNGSTNCLFDSTRHSEQRFYRVVPVD